MPKLVLFIPCEKLIVDEDQNPSLITIMQTLNVSLPAGQVIPKEVMSPQQWDIVTIWLPVPEDEGKTFNQIVEFVAPDGSIPIRGENKLPLEQGKWCRQKLHIFGMPIGYAGENTLKLWLETDGTKQSEPLATYSLYIKHLEQPEAPSA